MDNDRFEKLLMCFLLFVCVWGIIAVTILIALVIRKEW
jgi:hypothetical protein